MSTKLNGDDALLLDIMEQIRENNARNLALITQAIIVERRRMAAGKKASGQVVSLFEAACVAEANAPRRRA